MNLSTKPKVLALDMEGTLVSTSKGIQVRPYLWELLSFAYAEFERVVLYTRLSKPAARQIVASLVQNHFAPPVFLQRFEYIEGPTEYKDLLAISEVDWTEVLIVDDNPTNAVPEQQSQWLTLPSFTPYAGALGQAEPDTALLKMIELLKNKLKQA